MFVRIAVVAISIGIFTGNPVLAEPAKNRDVASSSPLENLEDLLRSFEKFYANLRTRASSIDDLEQRNQFLKKIASSETPTDLSAGAGV